MNEHVIICSRDELGTLIDNLEMGGAVEIHAKQINSITYKVIWKTEEESIDTRKNG